ncbi:MAG: AraC family transcriptional regulator, partial [Actinomycetota bacterium]
KATTTLSPLQYVKTLRLNDAAMRIANGADITSAATDVGYASPSQFSREFKRHFGSTPRSWAGTNLGSIDPQALTVAR